MRAERVHALGRFGALRLPTATAGCACACAQERWCPRGCLTRQGVHAGQESAELEARELNWGAFKPRLAEAISAHLDPIQQRYALIVEERAVLDQVYMNR